MRSRTAKRHASLPGSDGWASDYVDSRRRFKQAAGVCDAYQRSILFDTRGPDKEPISVDVATLGVSGAEHVVVLSSGVHGVEGYLGGAVQCAALQHLANTGLPARVGVVMVHAVNPFGFAHSRRVDENNVDVNRNFLEPGCPLPAVNPDYARLDALINPTSVPAPGDTAVFFMNALRAIVTAGRVAPLAAAIAEGQYHFPKGLFYGGQAAGESSRHLQEILRELLESHAEVTHLDVHSGLGKPAEVTLIGSSNIDTPENVATSVSAHYHLPYVADDAPDNPYDAHGSLARWYRRASGKTRYTYLCVEVGSVSPLKVLSALRRENRAHHFCAPTSSAYRDAKQGLRDVFAPPSRRWREASLAGALGVFVTACSASARSVYGADAFH